MQLHCFILYHRGVEKGWLVTFLIILPQMSALFVMSLIQTAGHTVAALVDVFLQLSNVNFHKKCEIEKEGKKQRKKENNNCYVSIFVVDYSIPVGRVCGTSVWFAFNSLRAFNCCRNRHYSHGLDVPAAHSAPPPTGPEQASAGG